MARKKTAQAKCVTQKNRVADLMKLKFQNEERTESVLVSTIAAIYENTAPIVDALHQSAYTLEKAGFSSNEVSTILNETFEQLNFKMVRQSTANSGSAVCQTVFNFSPNQMASLCGEQLKFIHSMSEMLGLVGDGCTDKQRQSLVDTATKGFNNKIKEGVVIGKDGLIDHLAFDSSSLTPGMTAGNDVNLEYTRVDFLKMPYSTTGPKHLTTLATIVAVPQYPSDEMRKTLYDSAVCLNRIGYDQEQMSLIMNKPFRFLDREITRKTLKASDEETAQSIFNISPEQLNEVCKVQNLFVHTLEDRWKNRESDEQYDKQQNELSSMMLDMMSDNIQINSKSQVTAKPFDSLVNQFQVAVDSYLKENSKGVDLEVAGLAQQSENDSLNSQRSTPINGVDPASVGSSARIGGRSELNYKSRDAGKAIDSVDIASSVKPKSVRLPAKPQPAKTPRPVYDTYPRPTSTPEGPGR